MAQAFIGTKGIKGNCYERKTLLVAPGSTSNKKLLVTTDIATRSKDASIMHDLYIYIYIIFICLYKLAMPVSARATEATEGLSQ